MTNINVSYITETTQPYVAGSNPLDIAEDWSQGLLPANKAIAALVQYINNTEEAIQELDDCRKAYRQQLMQIVSNFESATYTTDDGVTVGVIQPYGYYRYNKDDVDDVVEWLTLMRLALGDDKSTKDVGFSNVGHCFGDTR